MILEPSVETLNRSCLWSEDRLLLDYSGLKTHQQIGRIHTPDSLDSLTKILPLNPESISFCVRGSGHSTHLHSIPLSHELLLSTMHLNKVLFLTEGSIRCQSGVQVGVLQQLLYSLGWKLPVIHSGDQIGPTIGGFFMAGGFGEDSIRYGGFWNNVTSICWLDLQNLIAHRYDHSSPEFWEICGSGGNSAGLIVDLDLKILPIESGCHYPSGYDTRLPWNFGAASPNHVLWQTLFAPIGLHKSIMTTFRRHLNLFSEAWHKPRHRSMEIKNTNNKLPFFMRQLAGDLIAFSIGGELKPPYVRSARIMTDGFTNIIAMLDSCVPYESCELSAATLKSSQLDLHDDE